MGKGDMRTAKGKRYRGTFGKSRPKKKPKPAGAAASKPKPAAKPRTKR